MVKYTLQEVREKIIPFEALEFVGEMNKVPARQAKGLPTLYAIALGVKLKRIYLKLNLNNTYHPYILRNTMEISIKVNVPETELLNNINPLIPTKIKTLDLLDSAIILHPEDELEKPIVIVNNIWFFKTTGELVTHPMEYRVILNLHNRYTWSQIKVLKQTLRTN